MDQSFICGHKLPEEAELPFFLDKLFWAHSWCIQGALGSSELTPCDNVKLCTLLSTMMLTLAMVSCVVKVTGLLRQIPESPCHISSRQPTFSSYCIWSGILPCCKHHVLLDRLKCWAFVVAVENDRTMAEVVHFIRNHWWLMLDYCTYKRKKNWNQLQTLCFR